MSEAAEPSPADEWGERLPRRLGLGSAIAVLVGSTIGSGIFRSPGEVARFADTLPLFALVWVLGAVVALAGALSLAEVATMHPRTGGIYVYLREAYGETVAFVFGWTELLVLRPAAYGAIAIISAEYLWVLLGREGSTLIAGTPITLAQATAAAFIVVLGLVNLRGIEAGAAVQNVSTVLKTGALLGLVVLGLVLVPGELAPASPTGDAPAVPSSVASAVGLALVSVLWAYDGWADVGFVSGEIKEPGHSLPRAFIGGTLIIAVLYLAVNAVYVKVVDLGEMPGRPLIAADVAGALLGPTGTKLVAGAVMISTFGTLNGSLMTGPRVFYAMAEDGLFFRSIAAVHPRFQTPARAILMSVGLGVLFVSMRSFAELADQFIVGIWPFYALAVASVIVLRRRHPEAPRSYRVPGYPWIPGLFLVATVFLLLNYAISEPLVFAADVGVMLLGVPVFLAWRRWSPPATD